MAIKISTQQILKILYVITWIIFIGVCIDAGGFLFNSFYTLISNTVSAKYFWNHLDLSSLYNFNRVHFFTETTLVSIAAILRAIMFYVIVKFQYKKKLDFSSPFNYAMNCFVLDVAYLALCISLLSFCGAGYTDWLMNKGVKMPALQHLRLAGADVWAFMSVILFVIARIFKRGFEIQSENDLTV